MDRYTSFADLAREQVFGVDFRYWLNNRGTRIVVLAPHGGYIEPGTSQIACAIARNDLSLYCFESLVAGRPHGDLHITSTRFDEPEALRLVGSAEATIAVHGRADSGDPVTVRVGGRAHTLRNAIVVVLSDAGFEAAIAQGELAGEARDNICNRGNAGGGVQLELPRTLRDQLIGNSARLGLFSDAIRRAMWAEFPPRPPQTTWVG